MPMSIIAECMFNFSRNCQTIFQSGHTFYFYTINSSAYDPGSLHAHQHLVLSLFFPSFFGSTGFLLWHMDFSLVVGGLSCPGVLVRGLSSLIRDQTCNPWIGRWILNLWSTREAPVSLYFSRSDRYVVIACDFNSHFPIIESLLCAYLPSVDPFHSVFLHGFWFCFLIVMVWLCVCLLVFWYLCGTWLSNWHSLSLWYLSCF